MAKTMKKTIWISFDFGMKGDYDGLYKWLDKNDASERGYGLALVKNIEVPGSIKSKDKPDLEFLKYIKNQLSKNVKIGTNDRIYMIWNSVNQNAARGGFLFGNKKPSPWEGYAQKDQDILDFDIDVE